MGPGQQLCHSLCSPTRQLRHTGLPRWPHQARARRHRDTLPRQPRPEAVSTDVPFLCGLQTVTVGQCSRCASISARSRRASAERSPSLLPWKRRPPRRPRSIPPQQRSAALRSPLLIAAEYRAIVVQMQRKRKSRPEDVLNHLSFADTSDHMLIMFTAC